MSILGGRRKGTGKHPGGSISLVVVADNTKAISDALEGRAHDIVTKTVFDLEAQIKNELSKPGGGIVYGGHRASSPGEPPATDLGDLVGSVKGEMIDDLHGFVEVGMEYGIYLEYGTGSIAPRPFFAPSVEVVLPSYNEAMRRLFNV